MMMAGPRQEAEAVIRLPMGQASTLKMERNFLWLPNFWGSFSLLLCMWWGHYHREKNPLLDPTLPAESHRRLLFFSGWE